MNPIIEQYAEIEHEQWMQWTKAINKELKQIKEAIIKEKNQEAIEKLNKIINRWEKNHKPYKELPEEEKQKDREQAKPVINKTRNILELTANNIITEVTIITKKTEMRRYLEQYKKTFIDELTKE